jgi:hypothetical protein
MDIVPFSEWKRTGGSKLPNENLNHEDIPFDVDACCRCSRWLKSAGGAQSSRRQKVTISDKTD